MYPDYHFESKYHRVAQGHKLHYIDKGYGPVIVMLHGNPTWSFFFRHSITHLARSNRVIALDHLGCGLSDKPKEYNYCLKNHVANLRSLLDHLGIHRCTLMVHDWGGAIGMGWAVDNVERLSGLVILNTAAFRSQRIPMRIALCRVPVLGKLLVQGLNGFAWPATFMAVTKKMQPAVKNSYLLPYNNWDNRRAVYRFVKDIPLHSTHPSYPELVRIEKGLKRIRDAKIPLIILWGGRDFCFTREFFDEWQKRFPEAEAQFFENLGHYILEDGYPQVEPHIDNFLLKRLRP